MIRLWQGAISGLWISICVIGLGLMTASSVQAQLLKIGIVDLQTVLDQSGRGRQAKDRLKTLADQLQQEIRIKRSEKDQKEGEIQRLQTEMQTTGGVITDQARMRKAEEFRKRIRSLRRFVNDTNRFIDDATQEFRESEIRETQLVLLDIRKVVSDIGARENYTLILEGNASAAVVLYGNPTSDITQQVIRQFDRFR